MKSFRQYLEEAIGIDDVPTEPGKKKVTVLIGRFQPATGGGHGKMYDEAKKLGHPVVIFVVRGEKSDPKKSPFPLDLTVKVVEDSFPDADVFQATSAFIGEFIKPLREKGMEPVVMLCGTDRVKGYEGQIKRYAEKMNLNLEVKEITRGDDDVSATKVREALKADDEASFKKMMAKGAWKHYSELRKHVQ